MQYNSLCSHFSTSSYLTQSWFLFFSSGINILHYHEIQGELAPLPITKVDRDSVQLISVAQSCLTLCYPIDCSSPGFPVHHQLLLKLMSIDSVMPSNHLILCRTLLLPSSIFPSIKVFSNESITHIRWPKYWSFSFNISPSSEYSGLISFRIDWFHLLADGTLMGLSRVFSNTTVQ